MFSRDKKTRLPAEYASVRTAILLALAVYGISLLLHRPLQTLDLRVFDAQLRSVPPAPPDSRIVCIDIDDPSVSQLGRWPWPRSHIAQMISELSRRGAAAVAFDGLLVSPTSRDQDKALFDAICESKRAYSGTAMEITDGERSDSVAQACDLASLSPFALPLTPSRPPALYSVGRVVAPLPEIVQCSAGIGHITAFPDSDGVFRRIPLLLEAGTCLYPSLALLLAMRAFNAADLEFSPTTVSINQNGIPTTGSMAGLPEGVVIPVGEDGVMQINYAGPWGSDFTHLSFGSLEKSFVDRSTDLSFDGKICLICCTFTGGTDMGITPWNVSTPLCSVLCNALNTILTGNFIRPVPNILVEGIVLLTLLVLAWSKIRLRPWTSIAITISLVVAYLAIAHLTFRYGSHLLPVVRPVSVILATAATFAFHTGTTEYVRRHKLKDVLVRYMPDSVVSELLRNPALLSSQGERKEMSILCCSLANFDSLTANMDPEETVRFLQQYYEQISHVAHKHGGTVDKLFQSRLLAYFGHPIYSSDHPQKAVSAACEIVSATHGLLAQLPRKSVDCAVRAGIETGFATVGSFGAAPNMQYTIVGERVAAACQLEEQAVAGELLLTERTLSRLSEMPLAISRRTIKVKDLDLNVGVIRPSMPHKDLAETVPAPCRLAFERRGQYRILAKIGQGGMAVVYKGLDDRLDRFVALKEPLPEHVSDQEYVTRFLNEARIMARINHPRIVQIYTVGEESGCPFIAMEYIDGMTLEEMIQRKGGLEPRFALQTVVEIAQGLEAAQAQGITHRDIKPSNVLMTRNEHAKVSDFGLAKIRDNTVGLSRTGLVLGTPLFMSPEQASGKSVDFRSDIYSLGATFYYMLTGVPPFHGRTPVEVMDKHINAKIPSFPIERTSVIPPGLYTIIARMMAKAPDERFASYEEFIAALKQEYSVLGGLESRH